MQYMLLMTYRPEDNTPEGTPEFDAEMQRWNALNDELKAAHHYIGATGLTPDATTVRKTADGDVTVTDGPYAETKEILFSFYLLDVPDLDAAIAVAAKTPASEYGSVEIRPLVGWEPA